MENPQFLNLVEQCNKEEWKLGYTVFHNICDNTQSVVPWGGVGWFFMIILMAVCILALVWFTFMFIDIFFNR